MIFDGRSIALDSEGNSIAVLPSFEESVETVDLDDKEKAVMYKPEDKLESIYNALVLGLKDYMGKCGFSSAVLGLSGGIDSALVCAVARDAVGPDNVLAVAMPSMFSQQESEDYARKLALNLGVAYKVIPIGGDL